MTVIDDYLKTVPSAQVPYLEHIRRIIKEELPEAEEVISYGMPAFKYKKKYLIGFAAYKDHMSVFPTPMPIETLKETLTNFVLSKGTIQFTEIKLLPDETIRQLVLLRKGEIEA